MDNEPPVTQQNVSPMDMGTSVEPPLTPQESPVNVNQAPSPIQTKRSPITVWILAGIVIFAGMAILFLFRNSIIPTKSPPPEVIITPLPSPTPIRILSAIATQSAFIALTQSAASVSAAIGNTNLDDPSLSPPVIDLPLGFTQ